MKSKCRKLRQLGPWIEQEIPNAQKRTPVFGSTYLCEQLFSLMIPNKSLQQTNWWEPAGSAVNMCGLVNTSLKPDVNHLVLWGRNNILHWWRNFLYLNVIFLTDRSVKKQFLALWWNQPSVVYYCLRGFLSPVNHCHRNCCIYPVFFWALLFEKKYQVHSY